MMSDGFNHQQRFFTRSPAISGFLPGTTLAAAWPWRSPTGIWGSSSRHLKGPSGSHGEMASVFAKKKWLAGKKHRTHWRFVAQGAAFDSGKVFLEYPKHHSCFQHSKYKGLKLALKVFHPFTPLPAWHHSHRMEQPWTSYVLWQSFGFGAFLCHLRLSTCNDVSSYKSAIWPWWLVHGRIPTLEEETCCNVFMHFR